MQLKRKVLVPAIGLLAVAGIGTGVAVAQSGSDDTNPPAGSPQVEQGDQPGDQEGPGDAEEKGDTEEQDGNEAEETNQPR
jgi:hypothetical protein